MEKCVAGLILLVGLGLMGCQASSNDTPSLGSPNFERDAALPPALSAEAQQALSLLRQLTPLPPGTRVLLRRLPASSVLAADGGRQASLTLPSTPGNYYGFLVDFEPDFKLAHSHLLAFVDLNSASRAIVPSDWQGGFQVPGENASPFLPQAYNSEGGILMLQVTGTGAPVLHDVSQKPVLEPLSFKVEPTPGSPGHCQKLALVMDLGDRQNGVFQTKALGRNDKLAEKFASDADRFADEFLKPRDFTVKRVSQYWGNRHETLSKGNGLFSLQVRDMLSRYAEKFDCDGGCCHEFFLYLGGHGDESDGALSIYDASGDGQARLTLESLAAGLKGMPKCVKVIVFLDSCFSGFAIDQMKSLCEGHCGLTVVTSANSTQAARAFDSSTEAFLGEERDRDLDGKRGDFGDRFQALLEHGVKYDNRPLRFTCPGQASMCSTD